MSISQHVLPKRGQRTKNAGGPEKSEQDTLNASHDQTATTTQGKTDDGLETFTPEGKDLVQRVMAGADVVIKFESGPKRKRIKRRRF